MMAELTRSTSTPFGLYQVRPEWLDRTMPTLADLAEFLAGGKTFREGWADVMLTLRAMVDAETDADRERYAEQNPRVWYALHTWQALSPLYPIKSAHGPTMRQLLDALGGVQ